jgi:hypothetical protein
MLNEMSHQNKLQWLRFGQMINLEKILKQKIQQNINTGRKKKKKTNKPWIVNKRIILKPIEL